MIEDNLLEEAIEYGIKKSARYIDIRHEENSSMRVGAEDGEPRECAIGTEAGFGIRALVDGGWGFAAFSFSKKNMREELLENVEMAVKLAKAKSAKVELEGIPSHQGFYKTKVQIDPEVVPIESKIDICTEASKRMKENGGIAKSYASIGDLKVDKTFFSSEGARIHQKLVFSYVGLTAIAKNNGETDYFDWSEGKQAGYEVVRDWDPISQSDGIAEKAIELVGAKNCLEEETTVILDPDLLALVVHEIVGHPSEADRVLGTEAAWAGKAWWNEKVGERIGSELVNVVSDASLEGYFGSFKWDDEGTPAQRIEHLKQGVLTDYFHNRETAKAFGKKPNGAMRASSYQFAPLLRMTNTYLEKGDAKKEEIFEETTKGVYLVGQKVPSIDSRRFNFQISAKIAYRIKNGEITEPLRGASMTGTSPGWWSSIDLVGNDLDIRPIPNCGKGDPMQTIMVGNGGPHVRGRCRVVGSRKE
ncbi:TldD/PmbA family protein [Candidatus Micrarchaeota archaeon]|nr:TldD/PmbA family protein [Candidatus Micrarchaeota archaeon]